LKPADFQRVFYFSPLEVPFEVPFLLLWKFNFGFRDFRNNEGFKRRNLRFYHLLAEVNSTLTNPHFLNSSTALIKSGGKAFFLFSSSKLSTM